MTNKAKPVDSTKFLAMGREFSLYSISERALVHLTDGLKPSGRRVLWKAREGKKMKSATLAGMCISIHPHGLPESAVNTLAAYFGNNIPLLAGYGAFGTLVDPKSYGASRYTSVQVSDFTKDCIYTDLPIVPMVDNFDETEKEPKHFLPLIPTCLLNPQAGIATGFATYILPRTLDDIIESQISYLTKGKIKKVTPYFTPIDSKSSGEEIGKDGKARWVFEGTIEKTSATTVRISKLPYGVLHTIFVTDLDKLKDVNDNVSSYIDDSKDVINIEVKFKRGFLNGKTQNQILDLLGLISKISENMTVIDFNGNSVYVATFEDVIMDFSEWRLEWYVKRYKRLRKIVKDIIQRYIDILLAINNNLGSRINSFPNRTELKKFLQSIGIVNLDYIADLPVYRFTQHEKAKVEKKLKEAEIELIGYDELLASKQKRKDVYIKELRAILSSYKKGKYS